MYVYIYTIYMYMYIHIYIYIYIEREREVISMFDCFQSEHPVKSAPRNAGP